jgi:protein-arginine deiminase
MPERLLNVAAATAFAPIVAGVPPRYELDTVLVLGEPLGVTVARHAPPGASAFSLTFGPALTASVDATTVASGARLALGSNTTVTVDGTRVSEREYDTSCDLTFLNGAGVAVSVIELRFTVIRYALLCDANRDGQLDDTPAPPGWTWGTSGSGPVLLVNNDRDVSHGGGARRDRIDSRFGGPLDQQDMAPLGVRIEGPPSLSTDYELVLQVSDAAAEKIRIFDLGLPTAQAVVEPGRPRGRVPYARGTREYVAEGLQYPDVGFTGLVTVDLQLTERGDPISGARVVFRVAPWIMVSNVSRPRRVFMCEINDVESSNQEALDTVRAITEAAGATFVSVPPQQNRGDRWMQDELEIGYSRGPGKTIGVVLDSPRDRLLDTYPERLIAPDFGWVTRGDDGTPRNSLESFGNLEVSPPVTANGTNHPLGRIIFGGAHPSGRGRRMMKLVSDFLYAQQVQSPIELYSDWLAVGHVDEFMSFVPADDRLGFRLLLASPALAWQILKDLFAEGRGDLRFLIGKTEGSVSAEVGVAEVVNDSGLGEANRQFQTFIDWNRGVLKRELGLAEEDIIDMPVLYRVERGYAGAYFPDVVNLLVVDRTVIIPKPFGPEIDAGCAFETRISKSLEPCGLTCEFVDTWYSYHILSGEIHCGTNAYREPHAVNWWEIGAPQRLDFIPMAASRKRAPRALRARASAASRRAMRR